MSTLDISLYWACYRGDKPWVRRILANSDSVNYYVDPGLGDTALHQACKQGWLDIVKTLIEEYGCDPNVNSKYCNYQSPLHYACRYGHIEVVDYLIKLEPMYGVDHFNSLDCALNNDKTDIAVYICQHCISSEEMLNPSRIKTTLNLIKHILRTDPSDPKWTTSDKSIILRLVGGSKFCISHMPSAVMLEVLDTAGDSSFIKLKSDWRTAEGDNLLELACQSKKFLSQTSSVLILEWLEDATINQVKKSIPDSKTADGKTLIQLVCQYEMCISHISTAVLSKWLSDTTIYVNLSRVITPEWKTADSHTLLQVVCQSKILVARVTSTVLTRWLSDSIAILDVVTPYWKTADGDTLFELICQSEKCLIQISSAVFLKWLRKAPLKFMSKYIPDCKTVDNDTLLQLVLQSAMSISRTTSLVVSKLLSYSKEITIDQMRMVNPSWKTFDNIHFLHALILSKVEDTKVIELMQYYNIILNNGLNPENTFLDNEGNTILHIACQANRLSLVSYLIDRAQCDPNIINKKGSLPHDMTTSPKVINYLSQHTQFMIYSKTIVKWMNWQSINDTAIFCILKSLLDNNRYKTKDGNTLLHVVCTCTTFHDKISLIDYLLTEHQCDPNCLDSNGQMPLQLTSDSRIMKVLVEHGARMTTDIVFRVILSSKYNITESEAIELFSLSTKKGTMLWNPTDLDRNGKIALDLAYTFNMPATVNYFITKAKCDRSANNLLKSLLELTTNLGVAKMLIKNGARVTPELVLRFEAMATKPNKHALIELMLTTWNPDDKDSDGYTALYLACKADRPTTVNLLLSLAHSDPNSKGHSEEVPLQMTANPEIIKDLIRHGAKTRIMYKSYKKALRTNKPVQPPVKVFVVGNPSVGKSTLTAALKIEKSIVARIFSSGRVSGVDEKTVGIVPHDLESEVFGRVTLYDFAGYREFYSGHAALLQTAIQSTPPIFLLVINLFEEDDEIIKTILYWILFLENQCASVSCKPHIILVGSHADTLKGVNSKDKVKTITDSLDTKYFTNMEYIGFVAMNCKYHESAGMNDLRHLLIESCEKLRIQEPITFNAHCFLVFLIDTFVDLPAVTIKVVSDSIKNHQTREGVLEFLPKNIEALYKICLELNDRGHILLLKDRIAVESSYIVIDKEFLLSEISGTVFAPEDFRQYKELSSNTGVVPLSKIIKSFPDEDINILIGFLTHLEFCHEISDQALLQYISNDYSQASVNEHYYLFPGLISLEAETNVWETESHFSLHFGWILRCTNLEQFLTSRFLQVLLLRLVFSLALESNCDNVIGIHRKCSIWKNGIFGGREFGMETLVEVIEDKSVLVITRFQMSNLDKCIKHRSEVIHTVLECLDRFCPRVSVTELFIDASSPLQFPFALNSDKRFCTVQDLAQAIVSNCESPSVVLSGSGKTVPAERFLSFEPYTEIESLILQELWDKNNQDKLISDNFLSKLVRKASNKLSWFAKLFNNSANIPSSKDDLFHELIKWRDNKTTVTYKDFHQKLDEYSLFAGRNILVSMMLL